MMDDMAEAKRIAQLNAALTSIEQWSALMRRGQLTQPRVAGLDLNRAARAIRAALLADPSSTGERGE